MGDLKANPTKLMISYFDAHIYAANWGHNRLMLRFPRHLVDEELIALYCRKRGTTTLHITDEFIIVDFNSRAENRSIVYIDIEEKYVEELICLRDDILRGDLRALYLGWLAGVQDASIRDEEYEPPVPPGLGELNDALEKLVDFLGLDNSLLDVAAQASKPLDGPLYAAAAEKQLLRTWVLEHPMVEKDALLARFLAGEDEALRQELLQRLRGEPRPKKSAIPKARKHRPEERTAGQLLTAAAELDNQWRRESEEKKARAREEAERKAAEARRQYLESLGSRVAATWNKIEGLIQTKQPKSYDEAVCLVKDLQDVAREKNRNDSFADQLVALRRTHSNKPSLLRRLDQVGVNS